MKEPVLRVIAITDHDTLAGAWTALEFHKALHAERNWKYSAWISSADGHIIAQYPEHIPHERRRDYRGDPHQVGWRSRSIRMPLSLHQRIQGIRGLIADPVVGRAVDAVEVRNANPTEILNNHFTHWVNRSHLKRPEVGGSDLHFLSAMARAGTVFPGRTADDLIRAIHEGTTRAVGSVYGPLALYQYARDRLAWKQFCLRPICGFSRLLAHPLIAW
jgi:predicted metal-dependent phosphoesterase TrpH